MLIARVAYLLVGYSYKRRHGRPAVGALKRKLTAIQTSDQIFATFFAQLIAEFY
jgi:hypothetical protein